MYGGIATPKRTMQSYGGKTRKKYAAGDNVTNLQKEAARASAQTTVTDKMTGLTQEERDSLVREKSRLEKLQEQNTATPEQMERLQVINDKLGMSATPGRANVDR